MVGVRNSKGCQSCRQKKKGCDQVRPKCRRCVASRLPCIYPQPDWRFVSSRDFRPRPCEEDISRDDVLQTVSYTHAIEGAFWEAYLPKYDVALSGARVDVGMVGNLFELRKLFGQTAMAQVAMNALAFACIGGLWQNRALVHYGAQFYGQALAYLSQYVTATKISTDDQVIACCRFVCAYELFRHINDIQDPSSQAADWLVHIKGICILAKLYQADTDKRVSSILYKDARLLAARAAIIARRPDVYFLSQDFDDPVYSTLEDELVDIMLAVPHLMHRQDKLTKAVSNCNHQDRTMGTTSDADLLLADLMNLIEVLRKFRTKLLDLLQVGDDNPGTFSLYAQVSKATCLFLPIAMLYWTTCMYVYAELQTLVATASPQSASVNQPLCDWMDPYRPASHIIHMAPRLLDKSAGIWGMTHLLFPLASAMSFFAKHGEPDRTEFDLVTSIHQNKQLSLVQGFLGSVLRQDYLVFQANSASPEESSDMP